MSMEILCSTLVCSGHKEGEKALLKLRLRAKLRKTEIIPEEIEINREAQWLLVSTAGAGGVLVYHIYDDILFIYIFGTGIKYPGKAN